MLTADQALVFRLDRGLLSGELDENRGRLKPVNLGLKDNRIITFSSTQMFFAALLCVYWNY